MNDRTAFITGAARGLGKEIARALGASGHVLYLVDVLAQHLEQTALELKSEGMRVLTRVVDVASRKECVEAVADCVAKTGNLAVLVNCAAIMRMNHITDVSEEEWSRTLSVNLSGPFFLSQAALPHLIEARGNIVNIASSNGLTGTAYTGPYSATKAALMSLTTSLAIEYAEAPIRINALCPGPMASDIATAKRPPATIDYSRIARYSGLKGLASAVDVAQVAAFLASDAAMSVHGAIWTADLGTSAG